jgi:two-component system phosphate regulon sensor histidine kinase PhoR
VFPPTATLPRGSSTSAPSRWCSSIRSWWRCRRPRAEARTAGASRTSYGNQTIPAIIDSRARPQQALMAMLAAVMGLGVFYVARAAAREVPRRRAEVELRVERLARPEDAAALIQLFAETLELGRLKNTDRAQEYYRIINSEARKLTRLINNLLDFSKIEAGLRQYTRKPVNLTELTAACSSRSTASSATTSSRSPRASTATVPVLIDSEAAVQAIENLISNAMKYSPEHREISRPRSIATAATAWSASADRGIGVPARFRVRSSASSTASRPTPDRGRRAPASGSRLSTT